MLLTAIKSTIMKQTNGSVNKKISRYASTVHLVKKTPLLMRPSSLISAVKLRSLLLVRETKLSITFSSLLVTFSTLVLQNTGFHRETVKFASLIVTFCSLVSGTRVPGGMDRTSQAAVGSRCSHFVRETVTSLINLQFKSRRCAGTEIKAVGMKHLPADSGLVVDIVLALKLVATRGESCLRTVHVSTPAGFGHKFLFHPIVALRTVKFGRCVDELKSVEVSFKYDTSGRTAGRR